MQKRAENEAAANDLFIAEFIKTVQLNTVRPARQRSNAAGDVAREEAIERFRQRKDPNHGQPIHPVPS